jgi:hypothetical protein
MPRKGTQQQHAGRVDIPSDYPSLLADIKQRIRTARVRAALSANAELIRLYWDIGRTIEARQRQGGGVRRSFPAWPATSITKSPTSRGSPSGTSSG